MFENITTEGFDEEQDILGGGFSFPSAIYDATIKLAYEQKSGSSDSIGLALVLDIDGKEYKETFWYINKKGVNYYVDKNDSTKKRLIPGFHSANSVCLLATGKELIRQNHEKKTIKLYNSKEKKEVPTEVEVFTDLLTKKITVAILETETNKQKKVGNKYIDTAEVIKKNEIKKVFHTETKRTVSEIKAFKANPDGDHTPEFYKKWGEGNTGKLINKVKKVEGNAGAPPSATDNSSDDDTSLFD